MVGFLDRFFRRQPPAQIPAPTPALPEFKQVPYRAFTREFDRVVDAADLDGVIGKIEAMGADLDEAWSIFSNGLIAWRMKAEMLALEASQRIRTAVSQDDLDDTTVSILVDQSGSMRGQNMILAAAATDIAASFLSRLGPTVEVLGFTTSSWQGGQARNKWLQEGQAFQPGRLCDLLHIIYRPVHDHVTCTGSYRFQPMLRPDLPKENVDGEAIEWALSRLRERPQCRKILLVISDGAPVDDSTLQTNHSNILHDHLIEVLKNVEAAKDVSCAAVGIGFDVGRYYSQAATVQSPRDIAAAVLGLLEKLLCLPTESTETTDRN